MHVLLVEDDLLIGAVACRRLQRVGFAVDWVTDGRRAARALGQGVFALVILDLALPGKEIVALLSALQSMGKSMPVLLALARDTARGRISDLALAGDDHLPTPAELDRVLAQARGLLRHHAAEGHPEH